MKAVKILIYGPSGHGKTTSLRNLNPATTGIINCDRKELPLRNSSENYKTVMDGPLPDLERSNYVETAKPKSVEKTIKAWSTREDIQTIVVDTLTHMMADQFFKDLLVKGFDKFNILGDATNRVLNAIRESEKDVIVFAHNDIQLDSDGNKINKLRGFGKLLDEKVEIPSMFSTVLYVHIGKDQDGNSTFHFQTETDGANLAKAPVSFDENDRPIRVLDRLEPNDCAVILKKLHEYYG